MSGNSVKIDTTTQLCAVIGNPVGHSLSPAMHNAAFRALGLNYVYVAFNVDDVAACLEGVRAMRGFRGLSVTIPHKIAVMAHLDEIDVMAQRVGCVNTVTNEDGRLIGTVTDCLGLLRAFQDAGIDLTGKRVLFLGTGGAVRGVAFAVAEQGPPACITVLGRPPAHVARLTAELKAHVATPVFSGSLEREFLAACLADHEVIIHGTPVGMYPRQGDETLTPRELLRREHIVFDMVYRPLKTRLIRDAEAVGCRTILGLDMLVNQAVLQFERWTGVSAPRDVMRAALLAELSISGEDRSADKPPAEPGKGRT